MKQKLSIAAIAAIAAVVVVFLNLGNTKAEEIKALDASISTIFHTDVKYLMSDELKALTILRERKPNSDICLEEKDFIKLRDLFQKNSKDQRTWYFQNPTPIYQHRVRVFNAKIVLEERNLYFWFNDDCFLITCLGYATADCPTSDSQEICNNFTIKIENATISAWSLGINLFTYSLDSIIEDSTSKFIDICKCFDYSSRVFLKSSSSGWWILDLTSGNYQKILDFSEVSPIENNIFFEEARVFWINRDGHIQVRSEKIDKIFISNEIVVSYDFVDLGLIGYNIHGEEIICIDYQELNKLW